MYVLGGFAALGNPASFHNPFVRNLRQIALKAVLPLFNKLDRKGDVNLEVLPDRMMYRSSGQVPVKETWHRDVMSTNTAMNIQTGLQDGDEIYGGWINLDKKPQYLSCVPGSHLGVSLHNLKQGFVTIKKDYIDEINKYKYAFPIPPGHMVVFPQYLIHEVVAKKLDYTSMRLFTG